MRPEEQRESRQHHLVIPRTLVFLQRGENLLLLKGAPDKRLWAGKYNGLGGHVEVGETPYQAARREVAEEAGLHVNTLTLRAIIHVALPEPPGVMLFVFLGEALEGEPRPSPEGQPVWVSRDALPTLPLVEDLPVLLPRLLEPGPPLFAAYHFTENGLQIDFDL